MHSVQDIDPTRPDFVWKDAERLIAFGPSAFASLPPYLRAAQMEEFVLLATERSVGLAADVAAMAAETIFVRAGRVDEIAGELLDRVGERPIVALGGGRVIDVAKAIGSAHERPVAAIPTTLSGAPMTSSHRLPSGFAGAVRTVRPRVVIAVPDLMASQPNDLRTGSAMNALAHAIESIFVTTTSPVPRLVACGAIELIFGTLNAGLLERDVTAHSRYQESSVRTRLALGALEAGYAIGATGYAIHHVLCQTIVRIGEVPHALTYGVMLPYTLEFLKIRDAVAWEMVAEAIGEPEPSIAIARVVTEAGLPTSLTALGVAPERVDAIIAGAESRPELALTPGGASTEDLRSLVEAAL